MVRICVAQVFVFLVLLEISSQFIANDTVAEEKNLNKLETLQTRRKKGGRSTSSSSESSRDRSDSLSSESIGVSSVSSSSDDKKKRNKKYKPVSSEERTGWRKWHRKCTPCPEDMRRKWKDPSIRWVCGAYQRARRSFKSLCMMYYRNCQDGTMFVKIHDHRCANESYRGKHFFYEYKVVLTDEESKGSISDYSDSLESPETSDESSDN